MAIAMTVNHADNETNKCTEVESSSPQTSIAPFSNDIDNGVDDSGEVDLENQLLPGAETTFLMTPCSR